MITNPFDSGLAVGWLELVDYVLMRAIRIPSVHSSDISIIHRLLVGSNPSDQYI
jgi:hypothetical protein